MPASRSALVAGLLLLAAPLTSVAQSFPDGPFRLHSQWRGDDECLEANGPDSPVAGGGAFMDACRGVTGQIWTATPVGNGYFLLKAQLYGDERCLESNGAASSVQDGAAFMDVCRGVTGQQWQAEPAGNGYVRLHSRERGPGECLESNAMLEDSQHNGASFMETCENESGQFWRFVTGEAEMPEGPTMVVDGVEVQTGAIQVTLEWERGLDLDLAVTDPNGEVVSYSNPNVGSGGFLDVDSFGSCDHVGGSVENIVWPTTPLDGTYSIRVHHFKSCGQSGAESYWLRVRHNGEVVLSWSSTISENAEDTHTFSVSGGQFSDR